MNLPPLHKLPTGATPEGEERSPYSSPPRSAANPDHTQEFINAARNGNAWYVQRMLRWSVGMVMEFDPSGKDERGLTALMNAVEEGHRDVVTELLNPQWYIDVNVRSGKDRIASGRLGFDIEDKNTALMLAVMLGREEIFDQLLQVDGIDVNARNKDNYTALGIALAGRTAETLRMAEKLREKGGVE